MRRKLETIIMKHVRDQFSFPPSLMHTKLLGSCVCKYRCLHKRHRKDFHNDGLCMSGIGTIRLQSRLKEEHIVYADYENDKVMYQSSMISLL